MKFLQKVIYIILLPIGLIACNNEQEEPTKTIRLSLHEDYDTVSSPIYYPLDPTCIEDIPFADDNELFEYIGESTYDNYGVLDYRFARDMAFAELYANMQNYYPAEVMMDLDLPSDIFNLSTLRFTDKPVVVYDYDNKPYYYEFPLIYRGCRVIGTVTVAAQPFNKELIHYLFPASIKYSFLSSDYRRYVGDYPCVYYSSDNTTYYKAEYNEEMGVDLHVVFNPLLTTDRHESITSKINRLDETEINNINSDIQNAEYIDEDDSHFTSIFQYADSFLLSANITSFWSSESSTYHSHSCDTFALTNDILEKIDENIHEVEASHQGFLPEYRNNRLRLTRWQGYCGPAIMAWLYRGKYERYQNLYLPIFGDMQSYHSSYQYLITGTSWLKYFMQPYSNETGLYPDIVYQHSITTDSGLFNTIFGYTNETCGEYPLLDWGLRACLPDITDNGYHIKFITAPITWMRDMSQPVVVEGIHGRAHYCGAIGYSYNQWWIFKTYLRLFVTDNGYFTADHHYYPFWSILGGLNYAWVQNN